MTKVFRKLVVCGGMVMTLVTASVLFSGCGCLWTTNGKGTGPACVKGTNSVPFHVVMANEHGQLEGPAKLPPDEQPPSNYILDYHTTVPNQEARSTELVARMASFKSSESEDWKRDQCATYPASGNTRKVLIFIHGGLNEPVGTLKRARNLYDDILCAGYYPIFINWRSSLLSSYKDHLLFVRQGRFYPPPDPAGFLWSPGYVFSDVMRGVGRVFLSAGQLLMNDIDGGPWCPGYRFCANPPPVDIVNQLKGKSTPKGEMLSSAGTEKGPKSIPFKDENISVVKDEKTNGVRTSILAAFPWLLTLPARIVAAPILDTAGAGAWEVMMHRTTTLFHTDEELDGKLLAEGRSPKQGGVEMFLTKLKEQVKKGNDKWEFVLVGHSMGAIVLNQIVRDYGEDLPISHIVYLAAACSIRDYQDTVWPYLQLQHFKDKSTASNNITKIHHLMLHPKAESQDTVPFIADYTPLQWYNLGFYFNPLPRGSLLVWLDGFLMNPASPLDRTAGRFTNLMQAADLTPDDLRPNISFTVFEKGEETKTPQHHAGLSDRIQFWKEDCWYPKGWQDDEGKSKCWLAKEKEP